MSSRPERHPLQRQSNQMNAITLLQQTHGRPNRAIEIRGSSLGKRDVHAQGSLERRAAAGYFGGTELTRQDRL